MKKIHISFNRFVNAWACVVSLCVSHTIDQFIQIYSDDIQCSLFVSIWNLFVGYVFIFFSCHCCECVCVYASAWQSTDKFQLRRTKSINLPQFVTFVEVLSTISAFCDQVHNFIIRLFIFNVIRTRFIEQTNNVA